MPLRVIPRMADKPTRCRFIEVGLRRQLRMLQSRQELRQSREKRAVKDIWRSSAGNIPRHVSFHVVLRLLAPCITPDGSSFSFRWGHGQVIELSLLAGINGRVFPTPWVSKSTNRQQGGGDWNAILESDYRGQSSRGLEGLANGRGSLYPGVLRSI